MTEMVWFPVLSGDFLQFAHDHEFHRNILLLTDSQIISLYRTVSGACASACACACVRLPENSWMLHVALTVQSALIEPGIPVFLRQDLHCHLLARANLPTPHNAETSANKHLLHDHWLHVAEREQTVLGIWRVDAFRQ